MKRILFLIIRLLYRIPGWLLKIRSYNKHIDAVSYTHLDVYKRQDMVNGGEKYHTWFITWMPSLISWTKKHISDKHNYLLGRKNAIGKEEWIQECERTIQHLSHFPCISTWVIFNEGWGQFETVKLTKYIHKLDPSRFIDSASGWFDQKCGDFRSEHHYFDEPKIIPDSRAFILSEYGGYVYQVPHHISIKKSYGYKKMCIRDSI